MQKEPGFTHLPSTMEGIRYCKRHSSQEVSKITPRRQEKSCLEWFLPKENQSRVGTPESQDRDADGQTDILLKEKEKAKEVPV